MRKKSSSEGAEKSSTERLREALASVVCDPSAPVPTVSALCDAAGISRNALYRYHREILEELRSLQQERRPKAQTECSLPLKRLSIENHALQRQVNQLAALVDHYFCAWQECSALLQRRERELADLHKTQKSRPIPLRG